MLIMNLLVEMRLFDRIWLCCCSHLALFASQNFVWSIPWPRNAWSLWLLSVPNCGWCWPWKGHQWDKDIFPTALLQLSCRFWLLNAYTCDGISEKMFQLNSNTGQVTLNKYLFMRAIPCGYVESCYDVKAWTLTTGGWWCRRI